MAGGAEKKRLIKMYKRLNGVLPIVTVSAVIATDKGVLLGKRINEPLKGEYCLIGGALHYAEGSERGAVRKAAEEAGLRVKVERLVGVYSLVYTGRIKRHNLDIIFLVRKTGGTLKKDDQNSRFKFIRHVDEVKLPGYVRQAIIDSGALSRKGNSNHELTYRYFVNRT